MASVKKHLPVLKLVQSATPKLRKSIILNCELDLIKTIIECIHNTLNGNFVLTKREKSKLKRFRTVLRKILHTKGNLRKKRQLILQSGGSFLPALLTPIVAAASRSK